MTNPTPSRVERIRLDLTALAHEIEMSAVAKPVVELERVLRDMESTLLPSKVRPIATLTAEICPDNVDAADRAQIRDAHHRLISAMRHWTAEPSTISRAILDALDHWPSERASAAKA